MAALPAPRVFIATIVLSKVAVPSSDIEPSARRAADGARAADDVVVRDGGVGDRQRAARVVVDAAAAAGRVVGDGGVADRQPPSLEMPPP